MSVKTAIVIVNLGTPVAPTKRAVSDFLREFLSDKRVVEVPRPLWTIILNLLVIPLRAGRVASAYKSIWQADGSPLRVITEQQATLLQQVLREQLGSEAPDVRHAMTYSGPSIESVIAELERGGTEHILMLPLYPQYSATTTGSVYDRLAAIIRCRRNIPQIHLIKQYYDHRCYIKTLADSVREHWQTHGRAERLLMSFHGIPRRNCDLGDPYFEQCRFTAVALAEELDLHSEQWAMTFQSRLGKAEWLSPYTIDVLRKWGQERLASVDVICPAFSADCLETLEEIDVENRAEFTNAGGGRFSMIPCLNASAGHIRMLAEIVQCYLPKNL